MIAALEHPGPHSPARRPLQSAVSCVGVTKEFGARDARTLALRGVDLDVHDGQLTLLVGPSGCGKTTLISLIAGLLNPTQGRVAVLGTDLSALAGRQLVEFRAKNIGFVFQQYNLLPALSAAENAAVPLIITGWARAKAIARARTMLATVGLEHRADSFPSQLSGGEQQRVAIARALINEPRLLVCDEPTSALDARSGQTVMELIKHVAVQPGRAVIVVTHDSRVYEFGDRIVEMSDGRILTGAEHESVDEPSHPAPHGAGHGRPGLLPRGAGVAIGARDRAARGPCPVSL
jgi:putative ABC transport system ATP-binding protein